MYQTLTFYHSLIRWLVVISLIYGIYRAYKGYTAKLAFAKTDNAVRHWTATIAHIQLMIGIILYSQSPLIKYFWKNKNEAIHSADTSFFSFVHPLLMLVAIVVITIGSALAKRKQADIEKFKTMLIWFTIALLLIFIAIPWPFSPLANRPYLR
jgi:cytochrome bd-type quinol oxidase subunit 2